MYIHTYIHTHFVHLAVLEERIKVILRNLIAGNQTSINKQYLYFNISIIFV